MFIESTGFASMKIGPNAVADILMDGCIEIFTGAQPANADAPQTGTLIARITRDGGAWTPGSPDNGLRWVQDGRFAAKDPSHDWVLTGLGTGVAGWFRVKGNEADGGALSLLLPRCDGAIGQTGASGDYQLLLPNLSITPSYAVAINQWWYAVPPLSGA